MQQRAAFCQAMVHEPRHVLLDEPLGKLDAMTRESIRSDLQPLWMQQRPTVIFVTHSIEEAVQLSSRVCVITPRPGPHRPDHRHRPALSARPRGEEERRASSTMSREIQEIFHGYGVI